jgi:hypothetical protein
VIAFRDVDGTRAATGHRGPVQALRRLVGRILPFPRDMAASTLWHDGAALLRGSPPGQMTVEEASLRRDQASVRRQTDGGDAGAAVRAAEAIVARYGTSPRTLETLLDAQLHGERWESALRTVRGLRRLDGRARYATLERALAGRILVATSAWVPELDPGPPAVDPLGPTILLLPAPANVSTSLHEWLSATVARLATERVGLMILGDAAVIGNATSVPDPGFAGARGSIPVRPLDLGPLYPADAPPDRQIADLAWAAVAAVRDVRPARCVALVAPGVAREISIALAVRRATGVPAVAITPAAPEPGTAMPAGAAARLLAADLHVVAGMMDLDRVSELAQSWAPVQRDREA